MGDVVLRRRRRVVLLVRWLPEHVKIMFINGATLLDPVPPVTPVGMGKATRGVEVASDEDLDEQQLAAWMRQATSVPSVGRSKKR